jgi:hypothetical protein
MPATFLNLQFTRNLPRALPYPAPDQSMNLTSCLSRLEFAVFGMTADMPKLETEVSLCSLATHVNGSNNTKILPDCQNISIPLDPSFGRGEDQPASHPVVDIGAPLHSLLHWLTPSDITEIKRHKTAPTAAEEIS